MDLSLRNSLGGTSVAFNPDSIEMMVHAIQSVWRLSEELGIPRDFVHRVWRAFGLKPHLSHSFKLSTDPHFVEKVRDVVGAGQGAGAVRG